MSLGAITAATADGQARGSLVSSGMSTGVTVTQSAAPATSQLPVAVPAIKGPAPLPTEEQGLPG